MGEKEGGMKWEKKREGLSGRKRGRDKVGEKEGGMKWEKKREG